MDKKAQLTFFFMIAIVVIVIIGIVAYSRISEIPEIERNTPKEITQYFNSLDEQAGQCSIFLLGKNAGFNEFKPYAVATPEESSIQINQFFSQTMPSTVDMSSFKAYDSEYKNASAKPSFNKDDTSFIISHDYTLKKTNNEIITGRDYSLNIPVRFKLLSESANSANNEPDINFNMMADLDFKKDVFAVAKGMVFVFTDETSKLNNNPPYKYRFVKEK